VSRAWAPPAPLKCSTSAAAVSIALVPPFKSRR
jgi:hypothetical protein